MNQKDTESDEEQGHMDGYGVKVWNGKGYQATDPNKNTTIHTCVCVALDICDNELFLLTDCQSNNGLLQQFLIQICLWQETEEDWASTNNPQS